MTVVEREKLLEDACALSKGFLIVHRSDPTLGLAFCKGFLLKIREISVQVS